MVVFNRPIKHPTFCLLFVVLPMLLILGLSLLAYAVVSPQGPSIPTPEHMMLNGLALAWKEHAPEIIGILAFCLLEAALIIFLIFQGYRRGIAEKALKHKTEELDQFFNVSLDFLCIANTEGYFLRLNPVWERILGYRRDELMSKKFTEFVHPDDVRSTIEATATLASQKTVTYFMNRYRCKDGAYRWLEWSAAPAGDLIYAAARDITEHKLAEEVLKERLGFEQLLSDLSARFVNIPPGQVDPEINLALKQLLEFFQVDRCGLVRTLPGRSAYQITHVACSEDVPPVPVGAELPISINPWAFEKLILKGEVVAFSRLDDLPPEANVDKQTWNEWGIWSNVNIPILIGEPVDHIISINSVKSERVWPEELFPRLRLLGEILVNALERDQIRLQIEERLRFEGLISNLSAGYVNLPPDEVDSEINKGLRSISKFFNADRCSIGLFSEDRTQLVRAFEYHSAGAEPAPESLSKEQMPWYIEQLIQGDPVVMDRIEDLPPEAEKERQLCLMKGMKSVLSIPLVSGGITLGSFVLVSTTGERAWTEEYIPRLRLIGQIFVNAMERKQMQREIQNAAEGWQKTFDSVNDLVMILDGEFKLVRVNAATLSLFNLPLERVVGNYCYTLMHGTVKPVEICPITKMMMTKRHEEVELYDETRKVWLHVSADPIVDNKGGITRVVHTVKDITERKRAEEKLAQDTKDIKLLSEAAMGFVELPAGKDIYWFICEKLRQLIGDAIYVAVNSHDRETRKIQIRAFLGDEQRLQAVLNVFESDPVGMSFALSDEAWSGLISGKLVHVPGGIHELTFGELPKTSCEALEKIVGIGDIFTMGLTRSGELFGSATIIMPEGSQLNNPDVLETFVRLSAVALQNKLAEGAIRESERELRQSEGDLRRLAGRLISAQEEERSRLARELHDDLAQRLAVFAIEVGKLEKKLMGQPAPVQEELLEMKKDIVKISQDVHSLSRQLHPSILDDLGLIKAVESECTNFSRREGMDIVFNHENISTVIPKDISLSLYRIIQEGLRNISKHACAGHVSVSLKGINHNVLLSVRDDGIGFDSAEVREKPGLGFSSMRERVRLIHGELSIESQSEKGTLITVRVPLTREGE
jgi:PAS domain S-box-containing protein